MQEDETLIQSLNNKEVLNKGRGKTHGSGRRDNYAFTPQDGLILLNNQIFQTSCTAFNKSREFPQCGGHVVHTPHSQQQNIQGTIESHKICTEGQSQLKKMPGSL